MKVIMFKFLVFILLVVSTSYAQTFENSIWGNAKTDQERCQAEANYMAKYRQFKHVGPCIGRFEGIGYGGGSPNLGTCTPKYKMTLTGDAVSQTSTGSWVRVRSWR